MIRKMPNAGRCSKETDEVSLVVFKSVPGEDLPPKASLISRQLMPVIPLPHRRLPVKARTPSDFDRSTPPSRDRLASAIPSAHGPHSSELQRRAVAQLRRSCPVAVRLERGFRPGFPWWFPRAAQSTSTVVPSGGLTGTSSLKRSRAATARMFERIECVRLLA